MSGTIFLHLMNIIHFSSRYWYQNSSSTSCVNTMTKRTREQEGEEKDRDKVKVDNDDSDLHCLFMFSDYAESDYVKKSVDTQDTLSKWLDKYRESWSKKIQSRRSVEFSKMTKRYSSKYEETRRDRRRPGTLESHWRIEKYEETRRFRKLRNRWQRQNLTTQSISPKLVDCAPHMEKVFFDYET